MHSDGTAAAHGDAFVVSSAAYRDIAWPAGGAPLLLTAEQNALRLYRVEATDLELGGMTPLISIPATASDQIDGRIVFTPR